MRRHRRRNPAPGAELALFAAGAGVGALTALALRQDGGGLQVTDLGLGALAGAFAGLGLSSAKRRRNPALVAALGGGAGALVVGWQSSRQEPVLLVDTEGTDATA